MASDRAGQVRTYVMAQLESGALQGGMRLAAARDIAAETGVSLVIVQNELNLMIREGLLETAPRQGTYIRQGWETLILADNMTAYRSDLPWMGQFEQIMQRHELPVRFSRVFKQGMFIFDTSTNVQAHRREYMDLSAIFAEAATDKSEFFMHLLDDFRDSDGAVFGLPYAFSPRIIIFNRDLLRKHGLAEPRDGWMVDDLVAMIRHLRKTLPARKIMELGTSTISCINFIFRAGGKLLDPAKDDPVMIDHPDTLRGIAAHRRVWDALMDGPDFPVTKADATNNEFPVFLIVSRQTIPFLRQRYELNHQGSVPFPCIPGGKSVASQATDLFCVRKECLDKELVRKMVELVISEEFQRLVGNCGYGIPLRKSSAAACMTRDPLDILFWREMFNASAGYHFNSPDLAEMIDAGITRMITGGAPVEEQAHEMALALRLFMKISGSRQV